VYQVLCVFVCVCFLLPLFQLPVITFSEKPNFPIPRANLSFEIESV